MAGKVRITIEGSVGVGKSVVAAELVKLMHDKYGVTVAVDLHCDLEELPAPGWLTAEMPKTEWELVEVVNNDLPLRE